MGVNNLDAVALSFLSAIGFITATVWIEYTEEKNKKSEK